MLREELPDGTVAYRETSEEWAEQLLTHLALRMDQFINEIMIVCPPHRVPYWEREQEEISRLLRGWLDSRMRDTLGKIREEPG